MTRGGKTTITMIEYTISYREKTKENETKIITYTVHLLARLGNKDLDHYFTENG